MTDLRVFAVLALIAVLWLTVWALCRMASRSDREMRETFERHERDREMEQDKWWGVG